MKRLIPLVFISLLVTTGALAEGLRLEVSLDARQLRAYVGDDVIRTYDVAIGKDNKPTPSGAYKIRKVIWNPPWKPPDEKWARGKKAQPPGARDNPMKVVKMFFREPDYYIHGTDDDDSLGQAASHGCIRMQTGDVEELGKLVMEHGGKPMPEPWYRRIFHRRTTKVVYLETPVEVVIER